MKSSTNTESGNPYLATPLFQHKRTNHESNDSNRPHRKIIHSIVTPLPFSFSHDELNMNDGNVGEIEISIEEYHQHNSPLLRRIAIRSYGDTSTNGGILHASFSLPITPLPKQGKDWICWANFDDKPYLCALTGSETLRIFDVYPSKKKSVVGVGEGHSVSLPFEASSIFSLPGFGSGGLLIQRAHTEMMMHVEYTNVTSSLDLLMDVLPGPPSTLRLGMHSKKFQPRLSLDGQLSSASSCSSDSDIDRMVSLPPVAEDAIPSLYTLHHPLDEIRPCVIVPKEKDQGVHVWRKNVNFCDVSERVIFVGKPRCFKGEITDILVVTYHVQKKCHHVWVLNESPPPPQSVPLWKLTSRKQTDTRKVGESKMNQLEEDVEDRDTSPFSDLHAQVSMTCVHSTEGDHSGKEASRVFLATTPQGSGDFIISLLVPTDTKECQLKCIEFNPFGKNAEATISWEVVNEYDLPCKSAVPIEATTIDVEPFSIRDDSPGELSQRSLLRKKYGLEIPKAKDILLCGRTGNLNLYRGEIHVIDVVVPLSSKSDSLPAIGLEHAVSNRVDVIYGGEKDMFCARASFSLASTRSVITDLALSAIGSTLVDESSRCEGDALLQLCFAIRADCSQFAQFRASLSSAQQRSDDVEWESFSLVISSFLALASGCKLSITSTDSTNDTSGGDAWSDLLQSDFHSNYVRSNRNKVFLGTCSAEDEKMQERCDTVSAEEAIFLSECKCIMWLSNKNEDVSLVRSRIFDALHMLYEDMKIKRGSNSLLQSSLLADLLYSLCEKCISNSGVLLMRDYIRHYRRDCPTLSTKTVGILKECTSNIPIRLTSRDRPPCVYTWLETMIKCNGSSALILKFLNQDHQVNGVCSASGALLRFYSIIFGDVATTGTCKNGRDRRLISAIAEEGIIDSSRLNDIYSPTLILPLMDALYRCRPNPPSLTTTNWPTGAYKLIGRNDLAQIKVNTKPADAEDSTFVTSSFRNEDPDHDGLVSIEKYSAMLFPNDTRVHEAARLLRSSRPLFLRVPRAPEVIDHDYERMKQQKLALLCRRLLPLPVGRGMLTIGTLESIPIEPLPMPKICLAGRIPPQNAVLALEENRCTSKHKMWPDFHNGVATGLRLPPSRDGGKKLSRTWIVCNKPKPPPPPAAQQNQPNAIPEPDHTYGGFLLALGLRGYLSALSNTDICDYINEGPVTTAVGMMLGLAANKRGTCDVTISKTLCVHIPSLLPTSFRSIDLASPVQTAAVAGVGLLYQGSSHRLLTEFLLNEMGKRPTADQNTDDRESYTLCCGLSLGMVNLCLMDGSKQSVNDGLSDLNIEERLHRYIVGGVDENIAKQRHHSSERANANAENEKSSRIFEGDMINIDITAPGATLALGMIYHRSG